MHGVVDLRAPWPSSRRALDLSRSRYGRIVTDYHVTDLDGHTVRFQRQSDYRGVMIGDDEGGWKTTPPMYFAPSARVCRRQPRSMPTLLVPTDYVEWLLDPATTHEGAFGNDVDDVDDDVWVDGRQWTAVWKFPADLNRLPGFVCIVGTPLPVGEYPMRDDRWWVPDTKKSPSFAAFPVGAPATTKYRVDLSKDESVHYLQHRRARVAMVGTRHLVHGFWEASHPVAVERLLRRLYHDLDVYAFACYSQHHAIVLYADVTDPTKPRRVTPSRLADILSTPRGDAIVAALVEASTVTRGSTSRQAWQAWGENYRRQFGNQRRKKAHRSQN